MANVVTEQDGVVQYDDGSVYDANSGKSYPSMGAFLADDTSGDISLATSSPAPAIRPASSPNDATSVTQGWLNSAGAFGVAIASILTGRPVVATSAGRPVGVQGSTIQRPASTVNIMGLALLGLGVFLIVKILK